METNRINKPAELLLGAGGWMLYTSTVILLLFLAIQRISPPLRTLINIDLLLFLGVCALWSRNTGFAAGILILCAQIVIPLTEEAVGVQAFLVIMGTVWALPQLVVKYGAEQAARKTLALTFAYPAMPFIRILDALIAYGHQQGVRRE